MSIVIPSLRAAIAVPPWVKNELWRRARAVPSLDLRFADNKSLTDAVTGASLITFNRAGSGTYTDSARVIQTAATDVPRFDHDPITGESLGLLVEEQRTNLLLRSEEFDNASWTKGNSSIETNVVTAPNGSLTADKLIENTANTAHAVYAGSLALTAGQPYVVSVYLKAAERTFASIGSVTSGLGTGINLSTGVLVDINVAGWTNAATRSVANIGNGWYRVTVVIPSATGNDSLFDSIRIFTNNGTTTFYTGDGTSGIYLWGAQLEAGASPTSYIPTTTATATRSADVVSITGSAFSSWYRQDEGTFLGAGKSNDPSNSVPFLMTVDDGTLANEIAMSRRVGSFSATGSMFTLGVLQADMISSAWNTGAEGALALGLSLNNCAISFNGQSPVVDTSATLPAVTTFRLGRRSNTFNMWNGHIRRLTYWPQRLAESTLQQITQ